MDDPKTKQEQEPKPEGNTEPGQQGGEMTPEEQEFYSEIGSRKPGQERTQDEITPKMADQASQTPRQTEEEDWEE